MSKKDRLKAQKEKQDRLRKEEELEEQREREEARERQSRSAKKMMKKAKRTKPNGEPVYYLEASYDSAVCVFGIFLRRCNYRGHHGQVYRTRSAKVGAVGNGGRRCCYVCRNIVCVFQKIYRFLYT